MTMTLQEARDLVRRLEAEEFQKQRDQLAQRQREQDTANAARAAEDASLMRNWREQEKRNRIRVVVPEGVGSPSEFTGHGRSYQNHRGETVRGLDVVIADVESDGTHVCYLRSFQDFRTLLMGKQGACWERANSAVIARMVEVEPNGLR